ncbi:ABC transporter ATP-binding protein [Arachidicoccus terrestris]|uniref:ABC transporter ATP-binding protein n=1 Tax=Arachidicoccus terrestris TaxID=2875539 RepID=UPI001CC39E60|nr:ABC transporter ATP-binding protein [Arachidicoccus terrestris]UAY55736.1 ABC transporter ATP-binding protein [Arachidicoccus terrestris]
MESIVKTIGLSHKYTSAWAIKDINIDINSKGIYGLLGSNGAGKSTTMNIICGVLNQTKGDVFINGIDLREHPIEAKRNIGFLPQVAPIYLDLTIKEYLIYAAHLRLMEDDQIAASIDEVMKKCGIEHMQNRLLKNLSGGYRQRVGIAQSIIHKPRLVILDEPTNGLDPLQIGEVRNLIKEIAVEHTVILSSHILSEIQQLCQQIIMIEQGQLVFSDTMDAFNNYIAPQSMIVSFENPPASSTLEAFKGINRIEKMTAKSFRLFYDGSIQVSEQIIMESVQHQWRMTELAVEKNSIDEIFKQLTKKASKN